MSDFDREIESELSRVLGPIDRASIPAWRAPAKGGVMARWLGGAGAALAAKLVTGFGVAALAAAGAGVATEVAVTGSLNPNDWGQQVVQQVATCKETLRASGVRGIGQCVSAFAQQHGKAVSADHRNSDARTNDHGNNGNHGSNNKNKGNGGSNGNNGNHGKPSGLPDSHGPATTHP
jgi:hypothetical protein